MLPLRHYLPGGTELLLFLRRLIEVADGRLTVDRLRPRLTAELAAILAMNTARSMRTRALQGYSVATPRGDAMEIWGTVRELARDRIQALAARIEWRGTGWRCTAFAIL